MTTLFGNMNSKRPERLAALVRVLREVETRRFETKMQTISMFYDADNPLLVRNIAKELLDASINSSICHFFARFLAFPFDDEPLLRFLPPPAPAAAR